MCDFFLIYQILTFNEHNPYPGKGKPTAGPEVETNPKERSDEQHIRLETCTPSRRLWRFLLITKFEVLDCVLVGSHFKNAGLAEKA